MATQGPTVESVSLPARVAGEDEGIGLDELALAARNHGMPLEGMRYDVTPVGMHYLLTHYDIPVVDPSSWHLTVGGSVDRPLSLDLDDLQARPRRTTAVTLECAGNGRARLQPRPVSQPWLDDAVGTMEWTGTPLAPLLREAGVSARAVDIVFTGCDHGVERGVEQDYRRSLPVEEAMREEVLLAYRVNDGPLPPQHGYPLRLVVPGWYGMAHVKWLRSIDAVDTTYEGYQQKAYRLRQEATEPGVPVTRIEPRALVVPPGWPDFLSRTRFVRAGEQRLEGRAWSGWGTVERVEVTTDDGASWQEAVLDPPVGRWAWRRWTTTWQARPGRYVVSARATDTTGRTQPGQQPWNRGGFANTLPQRVAVVVLGR